MSNNSSYIEDLNCKSSIQQHPYIPQNTYSTQDSKNEDFIPQKQVIENQFQPKKKKVRMQKKSRSKSKNKQKQNKEILKSFLKEENETVLFEGELLKLCPGVERKIMQANRDLNGGHQYISRWCQLTENKFRYYKNQICALKQPEKPLFSIRLNEIYSFQKQSLNKDESSFEIILVKSFTQFLKEKAAENLSKILESSAEREAQIEEKRHSKMRQQYQQSSQSPTREVRQGHLMRIPQSILKKEEQMVVTQTQDFKQLMSIKNENKSRNRQINESFTKVTQNSRNGTSIQLYSTYDRNQWSKREETWYDIEEKLIFKNNCLHPQHGEKSYVSQWIKAITAQKQKLELKEQQYEYYYTFAQPPNQKGFLMEEVRNEQAE